MSRRSRRGARTGVGKASIDMNSLIDLTFLLLVTFILTIPAHKHRHVGILGHLALQCILKRVQRGGGVVEVYLVVDIYGNGVRLVVLVRQNIGLSAWKHYRNALLQRGDGEDERDEQQKGEVDQRIHVNRRLGAADSRTASVATSHQTFLPWNSRAMRPVRSSAKPSMSAMMSRRREERFE